MKSALSPETSREIGNSLRLIKAVGDSLVSLGTTGEVLEGTISCLGHAICDQVGEIDKFMEVL
jgi:hypothetical protein